MEDFFLSAPTEERVAAAPPSEPLPPIMTALCEQLRLPCSWKKATTTGGRPWWILDCPTERTGGWLTPSVEDATRKGSEEWAKKWSEGETPPTCHQRLRTQVLTHEMWPTPRASEYKDCGPKGSKSQKHMLDRDYLCAVVSEEENRGAGYKLNPDWIGQLMGAPEGWLDI